MFEIRFARPYAIARHRNDRWQAKVRLWRAIESKTIRHLLSTRSSAALAIRPVRRIPDRFASPRSQPNRWRSRGP